MRRAFDCVGTFDTIRREHCECVRNCETMRIWNRTVISIV